jgi:hypothetical protein
MRTIISILVIFCLGCNSYRGPTKDKLLSFSNDAPLEMYCFLNEGLSESLKDSICSIKSDLIIDFTVSIRDNELDSIEFVHGYYFNDRGEVESDLKEFAIVSSVLNKLKKNQLGAFENVSYGDYGVRVNFRRFCQEKYEDM